MIKVKLNNMVCRGKHGCFESEKRNAQRFCITITLTLSSDSAGSSDALEDTIDWVLLREEVKAFVAEKSFNLLEKLATEIGALVMKREGVKDVRVHIEKLDAWGGGEAGYPSVEVRL